MKHAASGNPYGVIIRRYVTEKATVLAGLASSQSNRCSKRCESPKAVFVVHPEANKREIAEAVEAIYSGQGVKVVKVNVLNVKPKKRRVRGKFGFKAGFRKAIVTLQRGDQLEAV